MKYESEVAFLSRSIIEAKEEVMTTRFMDGFLAAAARIAFTPAIAGRMSCLRLSVVLYVKGC